MEIVDIQKAELDILKTFIKICDENHLMYYLAWGSCLGAIRHKGFIPWDDDVDVLMPYDDYLKLRRIVLDTMNENYFVQDHDTDPHFYWPFGKFKKRNTTQILLKYKDIPMNWNLGIDIFPLFNLSEDYSKEDLDKTIYLLKKFMLRDSFVYSKTKRITDKKDKQLYLIKKSIYTLIPRFVAENMIKKSMKKLIRPSSNLYLDIEGYENMDTIYKKEIFSEGVKVPFEDISVRVPKNYHAYLVQCYGDTYHIVPEKGSNLIYQHDGVIVDIERDYTYYQNLD